MQHIQDTVSFEILQCVVFSLSSGRFLCVALPLVSEKREKIAILAAAELEPHELVKNNITKIFNKVGGASKESQ